MELVILDIEGKDKGKINIPEKIISGEIKKGLIWEAVEYYRANQRQGTVSTKTRGEVRGGGRKPWRQKGTGRARSGSNRSPIWRKGGTVFGPKPRSFRQSMPKKKRILALRESLKEKLKENKVFVVEDFVLDEIKTKRMFNIFKALSLTNKGRVLFIPEVMDKKVYLSGRNIPFLNFVREKDINAYEIWKNSVLLFTSKAIKNLIKRWENA